MTHLRIKAHAKVNLYLDVIRKRPDGYHEIETIFHSIGLHDDVILRKRRDRRITVACEHPDVPCDSRNLAHRAAQSLIAGMPNVTGVDITIRKRIPVAAGLGGGSADAAAVLYGMNELLDLGLTQAGLAARGARLGADVPFCLLGGAAVGRGIGEVLTPLSPLTETWLVLGNPGVAVSAAWAYQRVNLSLTRSPKNVTILARSLQDRSLPEIASHLYNRLEAPVFAGFPAVASLKADFGSFPGGYGALMSGSGATVFALMPDRSQADFAATHFEQKLAFCVATPTSASGVRIS